MAASYRASPPMTPPSTAATPALDLLRRLTGREDAEFRDGQLEAITRLVDRRGRVLCVQRTGWGKSAVYFVATAMMREAGAGPTILVSPLIALMRNQLDAAAALGIEAATVNSSNRDDWEETFERIDRDEIDLLLLSPGAPGQPAVPGDGPARARQAHRPARDRRGALHLRLGPRLPPRLPPDRRAGRAAARERRGAGDDGDRQRPGDRRRRGAARGRRGADHDPRHARPAEPAARGLRPAEPGRAARLARHPRAEAARAAGSSTA